MFGKLGTVIVILDWRMELAIKICIENQGLRIVIGDWGLGIGDLGFGIGDWDWGLGLGIWIWDWDWGLGLGIED